VLESAQFAEPYPAAIESSAHADPRIPFVVSVFRASGEPWAGATVALGDGTVQACTDAAGVAQLSDDELARVRGRREWITVADYDVYRVVGAAGARRYTFRVLRHDNAPPRRTYLMREDDGLREIGSPFVLARRYAGQSRIASHAAGAAK